MSFHSGTDTDEETKRKRELDETFRRKKLLTERKFSLSFYVKLPQWQSIEDCAENVDHKQKMLFIIYVTLMASPTGIDVLGQRLERPAENSQDNKMVEHMKMLAKSHLTEGSIRWKVVHYNKEDLLGSDPDP
nr:unnamed protein product [Callosobruchus analis]